MKYKFRLFRFQGVANPAEQQNSPRPGLPDFCDYLSRYLLPYHARYGDHTPQQGQIRVSRLLPGTPAGTEVHHPLIHNLHAARPGHGPSHHLPPVHSEERQQTCPETEESRPETSGNPPSSSGTGGSHPAAIHGTGAAQTEGVAKRRYSVLRWGLLSGAEPVWPQRDVSGR